jgi:DnaJ-class molecular chaperone with C-terminal Zn finger domain
MNDPYVTLGISRTASDEEVKKAYRELARKYHPDNYVNNPLADLAQEKMKEINEAYDTIEKERANGGSAYQYQTWQGSAGHTGSYAGPLNDARTAINTGDLSRAEMILGSIVDRGAEWNFLMGTLSFRRGWMDEASRYFRIAATMDPGNAEYRQAVAYMENNSRKPYTTTTITRSDPDVCNICSSLLIADCCCEMMGGDLIRCC